MLHAHLLGALSVRCSLPHHPLCRASQVLKGLKAEDKLVEAYSMVSGEAERMKKMAAEKMLRPRAGGLAHVARGGVQLPQLAEA